MKDFNKMSDSELKNILVFTEAVAMQAENGVNFGEMETTDESLREVEKSAREFAARRKAGLVPRSGYGETTEELAEIDSIRAGIRDYYKRTRKVVKG
jgi:hypothetical protein